MSNPRVESDAYDPHIIPAETGARMDREKEAYKHTPHDTEQQSDESIDTTGGYTVSREGLLNNYAIEPEMYINEPGDLREKNQQEKERRAKELHDVSHDDEEGKLTMERDDRGHGPGLF